jgi:hypothetical protein
MTQKHRSTEELPAIDWSQFEGMHAPTYTQAPDDLFDWVMAYLTGAELKVLLYIVRRTFGFKKTADAISIDQLCHGIVTRDGRQLDLGTGLKRPTVLEALRALRQKNLIVAQRQGDTETGSRPTVYALNLRQEGPLAAGRSIPWGMPEHTPGYAGTDGGERPGSRPGLPKRTPGVSPDIRAGSPRADPQETVLQETAIQEDSISNTSKHTHPVKQEGDGTRRTSAALQRPLYSAYVAELVNDFSQRFHDAPHAQSNRTRALRLWAKSGLDDATFGEIMQQARQLTHQRGNIARDATDGSPAGTKNRMPYFFTVLEDLLAMAEEPAVLAR